MMAILYGIYEFTFTFSEGPVNWLGSLFELLRDSASSFLPEGHLQSLIVSGVIDGVGGVLGFVPLIMFMFFSIAIMEDSGYMARVAYMLDRVLRWFGLHGNSVMALIVSGGISGGCAVPGVMATRTLRDPKERIATLLVVPFMNCGAKLPVFAMLIAAFFAGYKAEMMFVFTLLSWSFALFAAKIMRSTVLRGPKTPFVMELPPYRLPTLKGLLIHTWERTWQYVKKAGTIILGISIILWAMMTFPRLSEQEIQSFDAERGRVRASFLAVPEVRNLIRDEKTLLALDTLLHSYQETGRKDEVYKEEDDDHPLGPLVRSILSVKDSKKVGDKEGREQRVALSYLSLEKEMNAINGREQEAQLKTTIAGRMGQKLETMTRLIGFDYRTNIALVGGFAAKEVIVSTLGTAYSLGELDPEKSGFLSERLRKDPGWNPLTAFTLILFIMLYVPCFVTLLSIRRESSWWWAGFSMIFNLVAAYLVSLAVYQVGASLGLGL